MNEIPFDFRVVDWEGVKSEVRGVLGGIFVREAADNAFSWSARSERRGDRVSSIEGRVTLALEDGVISTTVERLAYG